MTVVHTYALLDVSAPVYEEIRRKLADAGYEHACFTHDDGRIAINMHGIALVRATTEDSPQREGEETPTINVGSRIFSRARDLFGKVLALRDDGTAAMVEFEWPHSGKPTEVAVSELRAASVFEGGR
jgi:hypothetical protein